MSLFAMLARPKGETRMEASPHFRDLTSLSEDQLDQLQLPLLPTPLLRFHDGNRCQYLGGMYPMVQPDSILRHKDSAEVSSQESGDSAQANGSLDEEDCVPPPPIPPPTALNLTRSLRYFGTGKPRKKAHSDDMSTASSHSSSNPGRKIRFDPRVTVTEFEDDPEYRQWFSDFELERFKNETIALAQQYLVKHPTVLEDYCKPYLDPVTGTLRKKALFSMLVLKATRSDDSLDEIQSEASEKRYEAMRQELADKTFERILIVNHNELALNLFERSLQKIFPKAQFTRCTCGDEALRMIQNNTKKTSFDLVLAEDRTRRPWKSCEGLERGTALNETNDAKQGVLSCASKTPSMEGLSGCPPSRVSAAELIRLVRGLELIDEAEPAMLIGVSTDPAVCRQILQSSGADAVWGLPPPHMSDSLRDELVARLIQKRRRDTTPKPKESGYRVPCHPRS